MISTDIAKVAAEGSKELRGELGEYFAYEVIEMLQKEPVAPHDFQLSDITQLAGVLISTATLAWKIHTVRIEIQTSNRAILG